MDAAREGTIGKFDSATLQRWADSMPPQEAEWRERFSLALESEQSMIADYALNWPRTCVLLGFGSDTPEWLISVLKPLYLPHVYSEARNLSTAIYVCGSFAGPSAWRTSARNWWRCHGGTTIRLHIRSNRFGWMRSF